jgi:alkaline phosphatase D
VAICFSLRSNDFKKYLWSRCVATTLKIIRGILANSLICGMQRTLLLITTSLYLLISVTSQSQIVAGPMLGQVEIRTAKIWVEVEPGTSVQLSYWKKDAGQQSAAQKLFATANDASAWFAPVTFDITGLDMNSTYQYQITATNKGNKRSTAVSEFTTKDLWQWRKPAPDFSFLTGSCAYFNEPKFDRPGKPYGGDSTIFEAMAKEKSAFMLWLGDNWYTREADYFSDWGLWYRAHRDRSLPVLQNFLKAMPHYAIWDDHDYGPNNADKSYTLKETSRKVFKSYWANPSYGMSEEGIYTKVSYSDADFFLMDDRYFRSADDMAAYSFDKPNADKRMWGKEQIEWLKNQLLTSTATFKFIVTGSQSLNMLSPVDCLQSYPIEFNELMSFLITEKINGVLFLTGDRHHSEVIRYDRRDGYPLFDITSSPLTSGVAKVYDTEKDNPSRMAGTLVEAQNYTRISINGKRGERVLTAEFLGIKGEKLATWSVSEKDLKMK